MHRTIRFLIEALVAIVLAGLVLGAMIPLLRNVLEPLPRLVFQMLVIVVFAGCVLAATLRPGGSLRR